MAVQTLPVITILSIFCLSCVTSGLVTKCKSDDSKCAKSSTQAIIPVFAKGLPERNVETQDPVTFKEIDASTPNLKLILTDVTITGLKDCIAKKVKRDKSNDKLFLKFHCSAQLESQYEMAGKLLILQINGKGPLHVTIPKMEVNVDADMGEIKKEGVTYWDVKKWNYSYNLKEKSDVVFENLFDGNDVLAQAAREVIANGGNQIIMEVGSKPIKITLDKMYDNVQNFFHSTPAEELSID